MSRFSKGYSYSHGIRLISRDCYRLSWVVDFHYADSNLRHPRGFSRFSDTAGALRFAKKWKLSPPAIYTPPGQPAP